MQVNKVQATDYGYDYNDLHNNSFTFSCKQGPKPKD